MSKRLPGVLAPAAKGRGGVAVSHHKNTRECEVVRMPAPAKVVLPMQQHIGAPCTPCVKVGDTVSVGQVIGDTDKFVSAPIHASVSGKVTAVADVTLASGRVAPAVTIESDGEMRLFEDIKPPVIDTKEDFIKAVRASGLVGLGGAGFPTHVKLNPPPDKHIDTLVINAAECEPFITVDNRECLENSWDILSGINVIKEALDIHNVIIAVEDNKPAAIAELKRIADERNDVKDEIRLMTLKSRYPQGAEKMMVYSATGRKVPLGKLPADVGCIVMNVASAAFTGRYVKTGKPLVSRSLTVDGSAVNNPQNIRVPIGTSISDAVEFCGGFKGNPYKILAGGPMMGTALLGTNAPIIKSYNAILAFLDGTFKVKPERDCIHCGRCAQACPMSLMPTDIMRYAKAHNAEKLRECHIDACMQCGSCAYSCPAGKPLVQYMILAKEMAKGGVK